MGFQKKNKISLRNLSMVMRQLGGSPEERQQLIKDSVERAKEAVQLDIADGTSWCGYPEVFFCCKSDVHFVIVCYENG